MLNRVFVLRELD